MPFTAFAAINDTVGMDVCKTNPLQMAGGDLISPRDHQQPMVVASFSSSSGHHDDRGSSETGCNLTGQPSCSTSPSISASISDTEKTLLGDDRDSHDRVRAGRPHMRFSGDDAPSASVVLKDSQVDDSSEQSLNAPEKPLPCKAPSLPLDSCPRDAPLAPSKRLLMAHPSLISSSLVMHFHEALTSPRVLAYRAMQSSSMASNGSTDFLNHGNPNTSPSQHGSPALNWGLLAARETSSPAAGRLLRSQSLASGYSFGLASSLLPGSSVSLLEYAEEAVLMQQMQEVCLMHDSHPIQDLPEAGCTAMSLLQYAEGAILTQQMQEDQPTLGAALYFNKTDIPERDVRHLEGPGCEEPDIKVARHSNSSSPFRMGGVA